MVMLKELLALKTGVPPSLTWTTKLKVPVVVGVPLMTPSPLSSNPGGSEPVAFDQVYGKLPPAAVNFAEGPNSVTRR